MSARFVLLLLALILALPAGAARYEPKKIKKWPELDRVWARAFDTWMSDEDLALFTSLTTTDERKKFLEDAGLWAKWERIEDEMLPNVLAGEVVQGMSQDEVYMCWDKPSKVRKDVKKTAYVDVLYYEFERDAKGREFQLVDGSTTAYKNEIFTKLVFIYNDAVFRVVLKGEEEGVLDQLPTVKTPPPPPPDPTPAEAPTPAPEATPAP